MSEPIVYKPQTNKGPVILLESKPSSPPTITLEDGTVVTAVPGNQAGGSFYNEGHYQYVFPSSVLGKQDATLTVDGKKQYLDDTNMSYRGNALGNLAPSKKGAIGDSESLNGPMGTTQIGQYGVIPQNILDQFPKAALAKFFGINGVKYNSTDIKKFAEQFSEFNTGLFTKNSANAKNLAFDMLDTELQGLKNFVPQAADLKRKEINTDNTFNQAERTRQVKEAVPDVVEDLNAQRGRAQTYASGRLVDDNQDRALELGVRSSAADRATSAGFGAQSGAGRKVSDLMSARERFSISQYGEGLLSDNAQKRTSLFLAPTSYSNAGEQVNVIPTVSGSQLQQSQGESLNRSTMLDPSTALSSQINQEQFKTNLDVQVKQFNAQSQSQTDQFNVSNINNFNLSKFNYLNSWVNAVAQALQNNINTTTQLDQQAAARDEANKQKGKTQKANNVKEGVKTAAAVVAIAALAFCDRRLKEDVVELDAGLDEILKIVPYTFTYKGEENPIVRSTGVMAQDLQEIMPHAVGTLEDGRMVVDHAAVVYALVNAVKELHSKIEELQERLDIKIENLHELIDELDG